MQVVRKAGLPVPKVICYGDHPDTPRAPVSILMTRVSGTELGQVYKTLSDEEKDSITSQLDLYLKTIRKWKSPWGENRICSLIGTPIRSIRVPEHRMGPFESEQELNDYLIEPACPGACRSEMEYKAAMDRAKRMQGLSHRIVFTHGDLQHHNIMVQGGRITGFLDWEAAGWYPEYWEFTTPTRFASEDFWWYHFIAALGGKDYLGELDCDRALNTLTNFSYIW
ncbi:hypothetical protein AbraIFM66950_005855 [Aspergillus brasiliensis]|nr:hypothetical protein AbraIFM66950_005855 [Aspergillus brasiliensis]